VAATVFEFGEFKLDSARFELSRAGRTLKLERKPLELLILLAARNGDLVTRAEIAQRLWGSEVFVDTEHGINTAIRKIRQALHDDPEEPRYVQTVTAKGYRFVGTLVAVPPAALEIQPPAGTTRPPQESSGLHSEPPALVAPAGPTTSRHSRLWIGLAASAALALLILAVTLRAHWSRAHVGAIPNIHSLAVLPLDNLSGDPTQEYLADGMTDELTTMLAKNSTLRIVSRTSAMQYKGAHRPLREIAQALGVDGILEGSVARADGNVHMTIQLIQSPSDTHLWAESYDRDANDVVTLPDEAAQAIAKRLNSTAPVLKPARYVNPEAHDAYLRGRYYWFSNQDKEAAEYFRKAIALQPDYALGWVGLSDYYGKAVIEGELTPGEANPPGEFAARKALQLDDSLSDAHISMAWVCLRRYDWNCADAESARAVALNPESAAAHHCRAWMLVPLNRMDEAIRERKRAMEIDPFSWSSALIQTFDWNRAFDAAISEAHMRLGANPTNPGLHRALWQVYLHKGEEREAAEELEKSLTLENDKAEAAAVHQAFSRGGYSAVLYMQLDELKKQSKKEYVSPFEFASEFAALHRKEDTLRYLEDAYRERSPVLAFVQHRPEFDFLHGDKRYRSIVQKIGLAPAR
jgi:TolB-like protein/DNA-binding winged helix-turn-helix (wHTH) protein